ncbi:Rmf/CrpP fold protein [Streptomyces sp. RK9]|uniref:Rmf/CrpP fold protein n=1 Tax=Streptomyces sp. RK9 TaxID=3239284 RepID=UPI00386370FF
MNVREAAVRAQEAGQAAARSGRPPAECPHTGRSGIEAMLRIAWVRGYRAAIRTAL